MRKKISILGAGLSGLYIGNILKKSGYKIEIFEAENKPGGLCRSIIENGFTFDIGGGHIIYSKKEKILKLMLNLLGKNMWRKNIRNTKILYKNNLLIKYPFENGLSDLPLYDNYECLIGYINSYINRLKCQNYKPKSFEEWIYFNLGQGIAKKFMLPYNEKIWKKDLSEINLEWIDGRIPSASIEDVIKSSIGIPTEGYTHQSTFYYPLHGGLQSFIDRLVENIKTSVKVSTPVRNIYKEKNKFFVNGICYDSVISTIPIPEIFKVLDGIDKNIKKLALNLHFNSVSTFLIGLDSKKIYPYSWIYLPDKSQGPCHRVTYFSNYSQYNTPRGKSSILAEITFPREKRININKKYIKIVIDSLDKIGILDKRKVCYTNFYINDYGYVIYDKESKNVNIILDYLKNIGIKSFGRFAEFKYLNIDQIIERAYCFINENFTDKSRLS